MKNKPLQIPKPNLGDDTRMSVRQLNDARLTDRRTRLTPSRLKNMTGVDNIKR